METTIEKATNGELATERDLDHAVQAVKALKANFAKTGWQIGRVILDIQDRGLWRTRKSENRALNKYKTFEEFCSVELEMTKQHAHKFARIAREVSEEEFDRGIGIKKFDTILQTVDLKKLSPAERETVLSVAEGTSSKELKTALQAALQTSSHLDEAPESSEVSETPAPPVSEANVTAPEPRKIHLPLVLDKVVKVPLLARKPKSADAEPAKIAHLKQGDLITARYELDKRTAVWFTLRLNPAGNLELLIKPLGKDREKK